LAVPLNGPPASRETLLAQWQDLAKAASKDKPNVDEASAVAESLVTQFGAEALAPLYDVMADPKATPYAKALAAVSLKIAPDPSVMPRLIQLIQPENDLTTRVCAISVLAAIPNTDADTTLKALTNDKERQVRFQALRGLAARGNEGRKALGDLWKQPDTTPREKADIINVLSAGSITDSLPVFQDALRDQTVQESTRMMAVQMLGRAGNQSSFPALNECAEKDPSEKVRAAAKNAVTAINDRIAKSRLTPAAQ
jgi:HEAT repeat protein